MQQDVKAEPYVEVAAGPDNVHVEAQVRVGTVDGPVHPASEPASEKDRATLEGKLADKRLPEGKAPSPVGYLYFPMLPMKKHPALQLNYETSGSGVILQFSGNELRVRHFVNSFCLPRH